MSKSYELRYRGNKEIEQNVFHLCGDCNQQLSLQTKSVNKLSSPIICSGCSKVLRRSKKGTDRTDYASFILTVLEGLAPNALLTRLTRASDVEERLDGAVKISRAVVERHDAVQAHVYTEGKVSHDKPEATLKEIYSDLYKAYDEITGLENYVGEISVDFTEDSKDSWFTDVYVVFSHQNTP
jgi:hypothetical protein